MSWEHNYCSCYWQLKQRTIMAVVLTCSCCCDVFGCHILSKNLSGINKWCCRSWYPLSVNCHIFEFFVLLLVSLDSAVSVDCPYSFAVHISNEYCWILMSDSLVLSSDCIAAVECCITLCGIEERKDQSQLNLSQKLCFCQKCIKPFALYSHHLALFLKFIFN